MEPTEATVDVYARLRATEYTQDRMCTRACVCVNTFVRLSPFACPTCKYTRRSLRRHTRVTCVSEGKASMQVATQEFRAVDILSIINYTSVAALVATQNTSVLLLPNSEK